MVIDTHAHFVPAELPDMSGTGDERWPTIVHRGDRADVMIGEKVFRTIDPDCWDPAARLAHMDRHGVERQVVSPMPLFLSYWARPAEARRFSRGINESLAELVTAHPARLTGLGVVPLQDPDLACDELARLREMGLAGVMVGSNVGGSPLGHPAFDRFLSTARDLELCIFVHSAEPDCSRIVGPPVLANLVGFPSDIGLAAASMLTTPALTRHEGLRVAFSHGGGSLTTILPRLSHGWNLFPELRMPGVLPPQEAVRRLWFDSLTYGTTGLRSLSEMVGSTRIMLGSDYPFLVQDDNLVGTARSLGLDDERRVRFERLNALEYLAIDPS